MNKKFVVSFHQSIAWEYNIIQILKTAKEIEVHKEKIDTIWNVKNGKKESFL